ncbi:MAG: bifunctional 3-deoxy-7-phosphoheptulonate synthase/chorismate mutase type II [Saprospiraceae bacterium]|nr:bifunctional 3-deoxy-7-phosphoheptulonate synthase/chorismate mutase type II [Saprospiraceae bacterium]
MSESKQIVFNKIQRPFIISGPCSAETEQQVLQTAKELKEIGGVNLFRAGIWKPRTRPDSFEGVGVIGLPWLQKVKEEYGFKVTTEVANARHVDLCMKHGIDVLWIGARSTVNPFVVQEIAEALKGTSIPVMVKNPINPDLALWIGAVERLQKVGLTNLAVIHRGFSNLSEKYYRNTPQWQIAIEFISHYPEIPIICDPSHICGRRDILFDVAQKAMDLGYLGLMIESHIDPDNAWSDSAQQIKPPKLNSFLHELVYRDTHADDAVIQNELVRLRDKIDQIDDAIIQLIVERMLIAKDIGVYKKAHNMTIFQAKRWAAILKRMHILAEKGGLSGDFITQYIKAIHDESIDQQERVMKDEN